jgi:hypothetical protein
VGHWGGLGEVEQDSGTKSAPEKKARLYYSTRARIEEDGGRTRVLDQEDTVESAFDGGKVQTFIATLFVNRFRVLA